MLQYPHHLPKIAHSARLAHTEKLVWLMKCTWLCQIVQCNCDSIGYREVRIGSDCQVDIVPMLLYQLYDFLETIEVTSQVRAKPTFELMWVLIDHFPLALTDRMTRSGTSSAGSSILSGQCNNDEKGRENSCQSSHENISRHGHDGIGVEMGGHDCE